KLNQLVAFRGWLFVLDIDHRPRTDPPHYRSVITCDWRPLDDSRLSRELADTLHRRTRRDGGAIQPAGNRRLAGVESVGQFLLVPTSGRLKGMQHRGYVHPANIRKWISTSQSIGGNC